MKNRNIPVQDNWMTPPDLYEKWNKQYGFDFDPCPFNHDLSLWDGLGIEWGDMNFVNPPYSQKLKEAFVNRGVYFKFKSKPSFLLLPVSTSTKLFHETIKATARKIDFLKGRISFIGINSKGQYVNYHQLQETTNETIEWFDPSKGQLIEIKKYIRNSGQFDSMTVLF